MHALGDPPQALRSVVDRIHARHDGQEHLRRTNVARRLLTPNVLLAGLQGKSAGRLPRDIFGHSNDASRLLAGSGQEVQPASAYRQWSGGDSPARRRTLTVRGRTNGKWRDTWPSPPLPPWPRPGARRWLRASR